ncbi:MAG: efflux RND transporter periplasmic adaptor subunit [Elusimicrobiota bacterium]
MNIENEPFHQQPITTPPEDWKKQCLRILMTKQALLGMAFLAVLVAARLGKNWLAFHDKKSVLPTVAAIHPQYSPMDKILMLPADVEGIKQASIYSHVDGYMGKLYVDEGDFVKKGQLMADIIAPDVMEAYNKALANYNLQEITRKRYAELLKGQVISQQEYDTVDAQAKEAKALLNNALANVAYTHITAPFSGQVARRFKYPGDLIVKATRNKAQSPIFVVVNEGVLRFVVDAPQVDVAQIGIGTPVRIRVDSFPGVTFPGKVTRIDEILHEATKTERVLIDIRNPGDKLHAGMFAMVDLVIDRKNHVLTVPRGAIQGGNGVPNFVYVLDAGKVAHRLVQTGLNDITTVEITQGISSSDTVLIPGATALTDGMKVNAEMRSAGASQPKVN